MPHTVPNLLQEVLTRLEGDLGQDTVATSMLMLICVRDGKYILFVPKVTNFVGKFTIFVNLLIK